ncbi:MAG: rhodanese-like domain-containing protein, partial [Flavobacteriaceae bacterium]|nr:rhodanese-like domain-containing protein [Flavobacteriaceae bacterium]
TRLSRVGFDNTIGSLKGGFEAWIAENREIDSIHSISAADFEKEVTENHLPVFDVRKEGEFSSGHLDIANHVCLSGINEHLAEFPKDKNFYVHCAGGYRSVIAASILKMRGYHNFTDIAGGFGAIKTTNLSIVESVVA